ncbi:hypothetical protein M438DRAFT_312729 [Aureobasidium pullulans EXF-150]|uniref:Zn(2)-C6 fungal-type domain-containing protein n=1 Tax=Aureobasidium pullulans EXF-150 TaxID=1043002 RepID=A0A074XQP6_AURPU|nr:uncharacterized protein M438DRAFT_312729 [Aureobasidium pullulans EXF-150]KEQ87820.1 hypothetical protein M438DRAFT_312729 [Aureobasidium pullulans EXF-150]
MRRSHRKSRNGCSQCKTRHIKCNEVRPQCGNCQRLDIACSFAPQAASPRPDLVSHRSTPLGTPPIIQASTQPLCLLDLELYHHFVYRYSASLVPDVDLRGEVFEELLEHSLSYSFLMHNFMALSALHLYSKDRSRPELFDRACYLQGVAIQQVQPIIANLRQEDSLAALLFSSHTSSFGLAEFMLNPHHDDTDPIDKIVECFQLSRGIKVVVSPHWPYLSQTWLKRLFSRTEGGNEDRVRASLASDFPTYSMVRSLAFGQEDAERRKCCLETIEDIFTYIGAASQHSDDYPTCAHLIDQFAVRLPAAFKDMLVERRPVALIILAYWAVLTSINPRAWHLKGLAEVLVTRIGNILGDDWAEFLSWPREKIMENARAAQDTPAQTPRFDNRNVDNQLNGMHLSHESSFSNTGASETQFAQPSPYTIASNHISPYSNSASNRPSPYPPASNQPSPYDVTSNHASPYSQGPPTG